MKYSPPVLAYYFLRSLPIVGLLDASKMVAAGIFRMAFQITVPGIKGRVLVRGKSSDLILFFILFIRKQMVPMPPGVGFIVDAGANTGLLTRYYAEIYPDAQIVAVEPDPNNFRTLVTNCGSLKNVECLNAAVWPLDSLSLAVSGSDAWSMQVCEAAASGGIPSVSMSSLLKRKSGRGATLVKMDIEGSEKAIFEHSAEWIRGVTHLHIEIHGCWASVFKALAPFSYQASLSGEYLCFDFARSQEPAELHE